MLLLLFKTLYETCDYNFTTLDPFSSTVNVILVKLENVSNVVKLQLHT